MKDRNLNLQLLYLFISSFVILFVGMGLFPLLPVYAAQFGATRTLIGLYFAVTYLSNTTGTILTGQLAGRIKGRSLFILAGILGVPVLALLGQATAFWQVVALTGLIWLIGGVNMTLVNVFTGLYSSDSRRSNRRGVIFSLLAITGPLGAMFGGTVAGKLVGWAGFGTMFAALAAVWALLPVIGIFALREPQVSRPAVTRELKNKQKINFGSGYVLLLLLYLLSTTAINASRLGTSLSMQTLNYSASAIAASATISGLVAVPVTYLIGRLSDRLGRKQFLMFGLLLTAGGAFTQMIATQVWHFWLAASLLLVSLTAIGAMVPALATDILAKETLDRGLARLRVTYSVAGILSFSSAGLIMDTLGGSALFTISILLATLSAFLLVLPSEKPHSLRQLFAYWRCEITVHVKRQKVADPFLPPMC